MNPNQVSEKQYNWPYKNNTLQCEFPRWKLKMNKTDATYTCERRDGIRMMRWAKQEKKVFFFEKAVKGLHDWNGIGQKERKDGSVWSRPRDCLRWEWDGNATWKAYQEWMRSHVYLIKGFEESRSDIFVCLFECWYASGSSLLRFCAWNLHCNFLR